MKIADDEMIAMRIRSQKSKGRSEKEDDEPTAMQTLNTLMQTCCSYLLEYPRAAVLLVVLLFVVVSTSTTSDEKPTPIKTKYEDIERIEFKFVKPKDAPKYPCSRDSECGISCHNPGHCCGQTCTCSNVYSRIALQRQEEWHRQHCAEQAVFCAHALCGRQEVYWVAKCEQTILNPYSDASAEERMLTGHCIAKKVALVQNVPDALPKPVCVDESKACSSGKLVKRHIDYKCDFEPCE
jgi:hypothetical protein